VDRANNTETINKGDLKDAVCNAVLNEADYQAFVKQALSDKKANLLAAPKLVTFDGNKAMMRVGREYPLGGELDKSGIPRTTLVGVSLDLQPTINADGRSLTMNVRFEESKLERFVQQPTAADDKPLPDAPVTKQRVIETRISSGLGMRVAIKTEPTKLLVFKCAKVPVQPMSYNIDPPGDGRLQASKNSRMREAWEGFLFRMLADQPVVRVYPLGHLLRENVGPRRTQFETLTAAFEQAFNFPSKMNGRDWRGFQTYSSNETLVVNLPPAVHDLFARMLQDVNPRKDSEGLGTQQELRPTSPVGN